MHKYTAKNLTNRTLQMHLPGGRYMRLSPGCTCSLNESDCKLPMVKKMMRKNALNIPNLAQSGVPKDQPEKPQEKIDKKQTTATTQQSAKDQQSTEAELEVPAGSEAGAEDGADQLTEATQTAAVDQVAEQATQAIAQVEKVDPSQEISAGKKKQSVKKADRTKKRS